MKQVTPLAASNKLAAGLNARKESHHGCSLRRRFSLPAAARHVV
jgi:hypothetical protein